MLYRWKNGAGEWEFIPIHLIKNSYLKNVYKRYKKLLERWENNLIKFLNKSSDKGIIVALARLESLSNKIKAIAKEFYLREVLGPHNFKNRGRIYEHEIEVI